MSSGLSIQKFYETLPGPAVSAWCQVSAKFADWKQYTNPRTKRSGWISGGGMVRYDDPRKADEEKSKARATAHEAFNATRGNGSKIGAEHVDAMRAHLMSLTRDQKRELAKSISAHVGGTKANLVDRLVAYAKGDKQPDYPKKPRSQSLVAVVQRYGGIDPNSHDFKANYGNMKEAIQDGIALGVFRKKGNGLDALAEEMHNDGYINVPAGAHAGTHLLEQLKAGIKSRHAEATNEYDGALSDYYKAQEEAETWAQGKEGEGGKRKIKDLKKKLNEEGNRPAHEGEPIPFADVATDPIGKMEQAGKRLIYLRNEVNQLDNVEGLLDSMKVTSEGKKDDTGGGNDK